MCEKQEGKKKKQKMRDPERPRPKSMRDSDPDIIKLK